MKQYYNLEGCDTTLPASTFTTSGRWSALLHTKRAKAIAAVSLLLITAVVLTVALVVTGGSSERSRSSNAASVESSNTQLSPTASPSLAPISKAPLSKAPTTRAPNSAFPSAGPSVEPSVRVTETPTAAPTDEPSPAPTVLRSEEPTRTLSAAPTVAPTTAFPTFYPTRAPVVTTQFRFKLHWEPHYFWQDEPYETRWCVECTTCPFLNFAETNCYCDIVPQCQVGHQIWIVDCDQGFGQIFTIRPVSPAWHQIQVVPNQPNEGAYYYDYYNVTTPVPDTVQPDLCWTRTETRFITLQACETFTAAEVYNNRTDLLTPAQAAQLFHPIPYQQYNVPFTISPAIVQPKIDNGTSWCLTNQHHPKTDEIVALKPCAKALEYHTGLWDIYPPAV